MGALFSQVTGNLSSIEVAWWLGCHNLEEATIINRLFPNLKSVVAVDPLINDRGLLRARRIMRGKDIVGIKKSVTSRGHHESCGGVARFTVTSNGGASSSLLPLGAAHREAFPGVTESSVVEVETIHLGMMPGPVADVLITDMQGSEHDVFKGNREVIDQIRFIYAEVCFEYLYEGQGLFSDISELLSDRFNLVGMIPDHKTFGNALWERKTA